MRATTLGPTSSINQRYVIVATPVEPRPKPMAQNSAVISGMGGGPETLAAQIVDMTAPIVSIMAAATGEGVAGARLAMIAVEA